MATRLLKSRVHLTKFQFSLPYLAKFRPDLEDAFCRPDTEDKKFLLAREANIFIYSCRRAV